MSMESGPMAVNKPSIRIRRPLFGVGCGFMEAQSNERQVKMIHYNQVSSILK